MKYAEDVIFFSGQETVSALKVKLKQENLVHLDLLDGMLDELTLNKFPELKGTSDSTFNEKRNFLLSKSPSRLYGVWVYYSWKNCVIRILDEEDFVFLRTVRNRDKIEKSEQDLLAQKVVGIVGLSVGFSVLMAIAMERVAGTIRIADFDELDLTNLNRLFHSITDLKQNKSIVAKRRILELDPFLKIEIFPNGLSEDNIDSFFTSGDVKLNLIIDECDSGDVKLLLREKARENQIPVIMETSDRGVLDIERYDLDAQYPLLHGMLEGVDKKILTSRDILMKCIDFSKISERGKVSMSKLGVEIRSWPQLASDVIVGGGTVCAVTRKLLLGHTVKSQRIYFDIESQIS